MESLFGTKWRAPREISKYRNEGLYTPPSTQGTLVYPFTGGGANWGSSAFDPSRNLLVVNMSNAAHIITLKSPQVAEDVYEVKDGAELAPMQGAPYAMTRELLDSPLGLPCTPPPWGVLAGVDLSSGEIVWRTTLGTSEDLTPTGLALRLGTPNFGWADYHCRRYNFYRCGHGQLYSSIQCRDGCRSMEREATCWRSSNAHELSMAGQTICRYRRGWPQQKPTQNWRLPSGIRIA